MEHLKMAYKRNLYKKSGNFSIDNYDAYLSYSISLNWPSQGKHGFTGEVSKGR